jgi:hypothetical protein
MTTITATNTVALDPNTTSRRRVVRSLVALVLALAAVSGWIVATRSRPSNMMGAGYRLETLGEVRTGHQRADRVAFIGDGSILATLAPRYNYLTLDRISDGETPTASRIAEVRLDGRPVALAAGSDRILVLQRPAGDARHLEPAWWDEIRFDGTVTSERVRVGFDPDDLKLSDDGSTAYVLLSGSAEGESNRPGPCLAVFDRAGDVGVRLISEMTFDRAGDDPERLAIRGTRGAVALRGSNQIAWIDLSDREHPRLIGRESLPGGEEPHALGFDRDGRLLVSGGDAGHLWSLGDGPGATPRALGGGLTAWAGAMGDACWLGAVEDDSAVELWVDDVARGRLRLGGVWSGVRPLDVAWRADRDGDGMGLAAVGDRSGGVHLIRVERDTLTR